MEKTKSHFSIEGTNLGLCDTDKHQSRKDTKTTIGALFHDFICRKWALALLIQHQAYDPSKEPISLYTIQH